MFLSLTVRRSKDRAHSPQSRGVAFVDARGEHHFIQALPVCGLTYLITLGDFCTKVDLTILDGGTLALRLVPLPQCDSLMRGHHPEARSGCHSVYLS